MFIVTVVTIVTVVREAITGESSSNLDIAQRVVVVVVMVGAK